MDNQTTEIIIPEPQFLAPTRIRNVSVFLDRLTGGNPDGVGFEDLHQAGNSIPGEKIRFFIENSVSPEEQELFKYCKDQMKKKRFDAIVSRASDILERHPSSAWAHFFYGVACKKIPDKEKFFVPAIAAAVAINPNFLSGWQALHKHFLGSGGLFSGAVHEEMYLVVKVLLKLEPNYDNWCALVGHVWDFAVSRSAANRRVLSLLGPYLSCGCPKRQQVAASFFINFVRFKNELLPTEFSNQVLASFQILISQNGEIYRLGLLHAALRYFNRTNDPKQVCRLLNYIHVNDILGWNLKTAKEFAYNLIYELFRTLGQEAFSAIVILRNACGQDMLNNERYFLCDTVFEVTNGYVSLLENANLKQGNLHVWGRLLYLKVLVQLKLYQEAYEQILVDLNCSAGNGLAKDYLSMLVDIFSRSRDPPLQLFTLRLGYKYLRKYGFNVKVLHCLCLVCADLKDTETTREMLTCLASMGAIDDVIYLQALVENDEDFKLDYLKSLENPDAYLLSAAVYQGLGKPKRVLKSMLEASFHFHGGICPFEWLGIHYYERDLVTKATRYFLEAFSNYLVSCISVNYIISIYSKHGDVTKTRAFFDTLGGRNAVTTDVACIANVKAGLNFMTKAKETFDFHRALERFRKVTDFSFERKTIEMVADSLGYFGMHGSAADFYLMCHAENDSLHIYPSILYGTESKMVKGKVHRYLDVARSVARKAGKSPFALFTYGCALFDRAVASYSVNNFRHCIFLCQQAVLVLSRCAALYSNVATFWIALGNVLFTVSSLHSDFGSVYVPSWLVAREGHRQSMVLVKKHESFVLALRCYSVAGELCKDDDMKKLVNFHVGVSFRYAKTFYKESGDRMFCWALRYALDSCDWQCWQRNNLCGVILTGLEQYRDALEFFEDAMLIGAREDARDAEFNLGIVYLRLGEFTNAHEVFMHRRGNDPMDSLVWRSYMLLHHCLGDSATVLHYLWYLIFSIRHYPSFEQGMEYLRLFCNSSCVTDADSDNLKKKCLLYVIFRTPMFVRMTFVGDCEVPHKFNGVTAHNYFYLGKFHAALGHRLAAEESLHEFLKLVAENNCAAQSEIDEALVAASSRSHVNSLHDLVTASDLVTPSSRSHVNSLHDLVTASLTSSDVALAKHRILQAVDDEWTVDRLISALPQLSELDHVCPALFEQLKLDFSRLSPTLRQQYAAFISRSLVHQLCGTTNQSGFQQPLCSRETTEEILRDILILCGANETSSSFLSELLFVNLLEEELVKFQLDRDD